MSDLDDITQRRLRLSRDVGGTRQQIHDAVRNFSRAVEDRISVRTANIARSASQQPFTPVITTTTIVDPTPLGMGAPIAPVDSPPGGTGGAPQTLRTVTVFANGVLAEMQVAGTEPVEI